MLPAVIGQTTQAVSPHIDISTGQVVAAIVSLVGAIWGIFQWVMKGKSSAESERAQITTETIALAKASTEAAKTTAESIGTLASNVATMTEVMRGHHDMMMEQHAKMCGMIKHTVENKAKEG